MHQLILQKILLKLYLFPNATTDYRVTIINVENKTEAFKATPNNTSTTTESTKNNSQTLKIFNVNTTIPIITKIHTQLLSDTLDLNKTVSDTQSLSIATDVDSANITGTTEVYSRNITAEAIIKNQNILKPVKLLNLNDTLMIPTR